MKYSDLSIHSRPSPHWTRLAAASLLAAVIAGCGGGGGGGTASTGASDVAVPTGSAPVTLTAATAPATFAALTPAVPEVKVSINSAPVVKFSVTDGKGNAIIGLGSKSQSATATVAQYPNIAFSLAKLVPGVPSVSGGTTPSKWVSYIVTTVPTTTVASVPTRPSTDNTGTLVDNGNGTYSYTFYRDITKAKDAVAAAAETATNKNADLGDLTYDPNAVHRLTIQISGNAPGTGTNTPNGVQVTAGVPMVKPVDAIYDFIPATGKAVTAADASRQIVATGKCNECHKQLGGIPGDTAANSAAGFHGGARNETRYCVVCHTEQRKYGRAEATTTATGYSGSTYRIDDRTVGNFPNQIHKIHFGAMLAKDGYDYGGVKFNEVKYPQDARNCTKCHDASDTSTAKTAQGDNWMNVPNRTACGGCHDGIKFSDGTGLTLKDKAKGLTVSAYGHVGGSQADDSLCSVCHKAADINVYHFPVTPPNLASALHVPGGSGYTNAASIASNPSRLPAGAIKVTYDIRSVSAVDVGGVKRPQMEFRLLQNGVAVPLKTFDPLVAVKDQEIWDNFMGAPSVYFVYALPQDLITAPADFNVSASSYLRSLWNGTATGTGAGTLTYDSASGYYTATLTGVTIPDTAVMLTGGLGFTYDVKSTLSLTQTNVPGYPVETAPVAECTAPSTPYAGCLTVGMPNKIGGLTVIAPNVTKVATGYTGRRPIVEDAKCNQCHQELGAFTEDAFHGGQRNDGSTCSWCHNPNRTSSGWSADSTSFVHAIHAGAKRAVPYNWHAVSATEGFWKVGYPGILKQCETCHVAGGYDFSTATAASALPNRLYRTVATGTTAAATVSTSPYIVIGTAYGAGYSANAGTGAITPADGTTLVNSPIATACFACHDSTVAVQHMENNGGSIYRDRTSALAKAELCLSCHQPTSEYGLGIGAVHAVK